MGYELHLRRRAPDQKLPEPEALTEALRSAGAVGAEGALALPAGGARLAARLARNEGALQGLDLDVPYGAPESDFRAAVLLATQLAARLELQVMDPQLGGELSPARAEDAVASWRTANQYAVNTAGLVEDARNSAAVEPLPPVFSPRAKVMLIALGVLVAVYLVASWALGLALQPALKPID